MPAKSSSSDHESALKVLSATAPAAGALEGVRVLDLTKFWAGPSLTEFLGNLGAEVIKVEAIQAIDWWRRGGARLNITDSGDAPGHELSPIFNSANRNKLGLTLDLTQPRGVEIFKELVPLVDVVAENYTPRVMPKFGLGYDSLKALNESLVMVSLPAFGSTGPWRDFVGFAFPTEEASGFPHLTGYPGEGPMLWGPAAADPIAGIAGAIGVLAALHHRRRTGRGQWIDVSQVEVVTSLLGTAMIDFCWNGAVPERRGNGDRHMVPHGCYPASGDDNWIVIAVEDADGWAGLCRAIGALDWQGKSDLARVDERRKINREIDGRISTWTKDRDSHAAAAELQVNGVAAAPLLGGADLLDNGHLADRDFIEWIDRKWAGRQPHTGMWAKYSATPGRIDRPAPTLGEHNELILGEMLGMSIAEIDELRELEIIGTTPTDGTAP
jgi:crotonobetainyl-CoA:carnitine CoA-transferase CaiB-like acyl-CoA transferase